MPFVLPRLMVLTTLALPVALAGCGSTSSDAPSRVSVEARVAKEAPNAGPGTTASCVELSEERTFRCGVSMDSATGFYLVRTSKDGVRIQFEQK